MQDHEKNPMQIGPLIPFCCEYSKNGETYGITLYGINETQVLEDNCAELLSLKVLGVTHEIIPYP